jgi:hypothetical protein
VDITSNTFYSAQRLSERTVVWVKISLGNFGCNVCCFYVEGVVVVVVDDRLVSWLRGYHPVAPRPIAASPLCTAFLVPPVISRGNPRQATWETSVSEEWNYGREMAGQFGLWFRLPRKSQGSFTCRKSATWDRRFYIPSEGRHVVDFSSEKSDGCGRVRTRDVGYQRPPKPLVVWMYCLLQICYPQGHDSRYSDKPVPTFQRNQVAPRG